MSTVTNSTIEAVIPSKARLELLRVLLLNRGKRFYLRELVGATGLPQGSVQRELANLFKAKILIKEVSGRQTYYSANERCPILSELRSMLIKTIGLADIIKKALLSEAKNIRSAFIFGSYASGEMTDESDIDLFIVGDIGLRRLTALLKTVPVTRPINPVVMSEDEYASRLNAGDHFIRSVMDAPRIQLLGEDNGPQ